MKWLANELAATKGELARIDEELERLQARRAKLATIAASLETVADQAYTLGLAGSVPAVRAHPARGGRGAIVEFFRATLRRAYPKPVDTRVMTELAIKHFGLEFATREQRNRFRRATVSHTLQRLVNAGHVERLHDYKVLPNSPGIWRWKVDQPSMAELSALAAAAEGDDSWP
ncbi:hypothetical protein AACH10_02890 [Ideonella sp. DXS22W]|uniref:Helix-turn-helix domain-containing protein n=1 Tax=Pseudaquabacterium inlustre TaxID=2984192 RepID=A0ABU9CBX2_9BURK